MSSLAKRYRFRPSWFMTALTIVFCAVTISAGNWQRSRALEKASLQQKLDVWAAQPPLQVPVTPVDSKDIELRPVVATGRYVVDRTILIDNKVYRGRVGYHVVTPLRLEDSDMHVLVVRGWVVGGATRDQLPVIQTPEGVRQVEGIAAIPSDRVLELAEVQPGYVWQNLLLDRYAAWSKLKLQPFIIRQTNDVADGLVRDWPRPDVGIEKHRIYAMQWYSFATLSLILYVALNLKRNRD